MATCQTRYHGELEYPEEAVVQFARGLFGFDEERRFLMIENPAARPIVFLQSLMTPNLCFVALPVRVVEPDYRLELAPEDLEQIGLAADTPPRIGDDVFCLTLLTVRDGGPTTANLLAPVVVSMHDRRAVQAIATHAGYSHEAPFATEGVGCS